MQKDLENITSKEVRNLEFSCPKARSGISVGMGLEIVSEWGARVA